MVKQCITFLSALLILFAASSSIAQEKKQKKQKEQESSFTDSTKAIQVVRSSPVITLKLKSNPSTGFSWFLVGYDHGLLVPISRVFVPPTKEMPGAPGYEIWRFGVSPHAFVVPQMTYITLRYLRPWVVPANARKLKFTVAIQEMAQPKAK